MVCAARGQGGGGNSKREVFCKQRDKYLNRGESIKLLLTESPDPSSSAGLEPTKV